MTMRREYRRTKVSAAESAELWERWKKGEGLHAIGQALGRGHTSIAAHVRPSGGIRPPARRRSMRALTMVEREEISRGIVGGLSIRAIALRRSVARSAAMADCGATGLKQPRSWRGNGLFAQSSASWRYAASCGKLLLRN